MKTVSIILTLLISGSVANSQMIDQPSDSMSSASVKTLQFDANVEAPLKAQVLDDLKFMTSIQGSGASPMHKYVFGTVNGSNYSKWLGSRVYTLGKSDCGSGNAVACVYSAIPNKMFITKNYTQFDHPQIARLSVIYHEARHTEMNHGNWGHATCPTPFKNEKGEDMRSIWTGAMLQGEPACDITPYGSYGSQTILLRNIGLNCTNCSSKVKADANLFAADQLGRISDAKVKLAMKQDLQF